MNCTGCGHRDLGDSWHGGRPFQCVHEYEAWRDRVVQLELGL